MTKYPLLYLALSTFLTATLPSICYAESLRCEVPAQSIVSQANDFCFLQFSTDDIAHPGVEVCVSTFSALADNCENRTNLKAFRCYILQAKGLLKKEMSMEQCVSSADTEGYFVRGCEYPFQADCVARVNKGSR